MKNASSAAGSGVAAKEYSLRYKTYWPTSIFLVIDRMTDAIWENYRRDRALYIFWQWRQCGACLSFCV